LFKRLDCVAEHLRPAYTVPKPLVETRRYHN
jgi:hypothetical protein